MPNHHKNTTLAVRLCLGLLVTCTIACGGPDPNQLWTEGKRSEAINVYKRQIASKSTTDSAAFARVIEDCLERNDKSGAAEFCMLAAAAKVYVPLSSPELQKVYEQARGFYAVEAEQERARHLAEQQQRRTVGSSKTDAIEVWTMAQQFVRDQLKSPSTADFGGLLSEYQDPKQCVKSLGDGKYRVTGWVDSQNGFGATVRTDFVIDVKDHGDGNNWSLVGQPIMVQRR